MAAMAARRFTPMRIPNPSGFGAQPARAGSYVLAVTVAAAPAFSRLPTPLRTAFARPADTLQTRRGAAHGLRAKTVGFGIRIGVNARAAIAAIAGPEARLEHFWL